MTGRTRVVAGPFWTRRKARRVEREWQARLAALPRMTAHAAAFTLGLPSWTRGVRVEKAGRASWVVVATEEAGH